MGKKHLMPKIAGLVKRLFKKVNVVKSCFKNRRRQKDRRPKTYLRQKGLAKTSTLKMAQKHGAKRPLQKSEGIKNSAVKKVSIKKLLVKNSCWVKMLPAPSKMTCWKKADGKIIIVKNEYLQF